MNRVGFLTGLAFGFVLAAARLNDYDVIHGMLLLRQFDLWLMFAATIGTAAPLLWLLERRRWQTPLGGQLKRHRSPVEPKNVLGAMVFGTGWAITGACPGTALAMAGSGTLLGLFVMAGLLSGMLMHDGVAARTTGGGAPARQARGAWKRAAALLRLAAGLALLGAALVSWAPASASGNNPPVATLERVRLIEDTPLVFRLTGYDPDGDQPVAYVIANPSIGHLYQVNLDGTRGAVIVPGIGERVPISHPQRLVWFEPVPETYGTPYTSFRYFLADSGGLESNTQEVIVDVTSAPDPPVAVPRIHTGRTDSAVTGINLEFRDADLAAPQGVVTVHVTRLPTHGTLYVGTLDPANRIGATRNTSFRDAHLFYVSEHGDRCVAGTDRFSWFVEDETGRRSAEVTDLLRIERRNCPASPVDSPVDVSTTPGTQVPVVLRATTLAPVRVDEISVMPLTTPAHGRLVVLNPPFQPVAVSPGVVLPNLWSCLDEACTRGEFRAGFQELAYIPDPSFTSDVGGPDSFSYCFNANPSLNTCGQGTGPYTVSLWVSNNPGVPWISGISPVSATPGSSPTLTVTGAGFTPDSAVHLNGAPLTTTYVSASQLTATVPALATGAAEVTVVTPSPGGGTSNPRFIFVAQSPVGDAMIATAKGAGASARLGAWAGSAYAETDGAGTLGIAQLSANPLGMINLPGATGFFAAPISSASNFESLGLWACGGNAVFYSTGGTWQRASNQSTTGSCVGVLIDDTTAPSLRDLRGTFFGIGNIDLTPPMTTASASAGDAPYSFGAWTNRSATVRLDAADEGGSGVKGTSYVLDGASSQTYAGPILIDGEGAHTLRFWSEDHAGNVEDTAMQLDDPGTPANEQRSANTVEIGVDRTAPAITASAKHDDGTAYTPGTWTSQPVMVTFTCTDDGSGPISNGATLRFPVGTVNQSTDEWTCTDRAGNSSSAAFGPINIGEGPVDTAPPTTTIVLSPASPNGANGWYRSDVAVTIAGVDAVDGSGVAETRCVLDPSSVPSTFAALPTAPCPYLGAGAPVVAEGSHVIYAASKDAAGNEEAVRSVAFKIDKTPPSLTVPGNLSVPATSADGAVVTYTVTATDALDRSPTVTCSPASGSTFAPGTTAVSCTATDAAGNTSAAKTFEVAVRYQVSGFLPPIAWSASSIVYNSVKAGSTVPLKFEVFAGTTEMTDTAIVGPIALRKVDCQSGATAVDLTATTTGGTYLRYDADARQFVYNWETPRKPGSCLRLTLPLQDGSSLEAYFVLR